MEEKESTALSEVSHEADQDSEVQEAGRNSNDSDVQSSTSGQESEKENKEDSEEKSLDSSSESSEDSSSPVEDEKEDKTENITEEDSENDSDASESTGSDSEEETTESTTEEDSESSEGAESNSEEDLSEEYTTEEITEPVPVMLLQDGTVTAYGVDGSIYPLYSTYDEFMESPLYVTRYENEVLNRLEFIQYALALLVALIFLLIFKKK